MPFVKKTVEQLTKEVIDDFGYNPEEHKPLIDLTVKKLLKREEIAESLYKQKKNAQKEAEDAKKLAEEAAKKGKGSEGGDKEETKRIVAEQMFLAQGGSKTALHQLHKIMKATGKNFWEAQNDELFVSFKEKQEKERISRDSQLPPSRGGSNASAKEVDKIAAEAEGNLPPGYEVKPKK